MLPTHRHTHTHTPAPPHTHTTQNSASLFLAPVTMGSLPQDNEETLPQRTPQTWMGGGLGLETKTRDLMPQLSWSLTRWHHLPASFSITSLSCIQVTREPTVRQRVWEWGFCRTPYSG